MPVRRLAVLLGTLLAAVAAGSAFSGTDGTQGKKAKGRETFGPPAPSPSRAAGSVLRYEPGHHIVVAEVGVVGRVFRIEPSTEITARVATGVRVRILYVEGIDGPVARRIMPGPVEAAAPGSKRGPGGGP